MAIAQLFDNASSTRKKVCLESSEYITVQRKIITSKDLAVSSIQSSIIQPSSATDAIKDYSTKT